MSYLPITPSVATLRQVATIGTLEAKHLAMTPIARKVAGFALALLGALSITSYGRAFWGFVFSPIHNRAEKLRIKNKLLPLIQQNKKAEFDSFLVEHMLGTDQKPRTPTFANLNNFLEGFTAAFETYQQSVQPRKPEGKLTSLAWSGWKLPEGFTEGLQALAEEKDPVWKVQRASTFIKPEHNVLKKVLSADERKTLFIDRHLAPFNDVIISLGSAFSNFVDLMHDIQDSPKVVYSLLFTFIAPYTYTKVWEALKPQLVDRLGDPESLSLHHGGKIALFLLGLTLFIYYISRQERLVGISDLTAEIRDGVYPRIHLDQYKEISKEFITKFRHCALHPERPDLGFTIAENGGGLVKPLIRTLGEMVVSDRINIPDNPHRRVEVGGIWSARLSKIRNQCSTPAKVDRWFNRLDRSLNALKGPVYLAVRDGKTLKEILGTDSSQGEFVSDKAVFEAKLKLKENFTNRLRDRRIRLIITGPAELQEAVEDDSDISDLFEFIQSNSINRDQLTRLLDTTFNQKLAVVPSTPKRVIAEHTQGIEARGKLDESPQHGFKHVRQAVLADHNRLQDKIYRDDNLRDLFLSFAAREANANGIAADLKNRLLRKFEIQREKKVPAKKLAYDANRLFLLDSFVLPTLFYHAKAVLKSNVPIQYTIDRDRFVMKLTQHERMLVGSATKEQFGQLLKLKETLKEKYKAQAETIEEIMQAIINRRITPPKLFRPPLVFTSVGNPGVGKSQFIRDLYAGYFRILRVQPGNKPLEHFLHIPAPVEFQQNVDSKTAVQKMLKKIKKGPCVIDIEEIEKTSDPAVFAKLMWLMGPDPTQHNFHCPLSEETSEELVDRQDAIIFMTLNAPILRKDKPTEQRGSAAEAIEDVYQRSQRLSPQATGSRGNHKPGPFTQRTRIAAFADLSDLEKQSILEANIKEELGDIEQMKGCTIDYDLAALVNCIKKGVRGEARQAKEHAQWMIQTAYSKLLEKQWDLEGVKIALKIKKDSIKFKILTNS